MIRRILVPLDGSQLAECTLPHAIAMGQAFDAELLLLRVLEIDGDGSTPVDGVEWRLSRAEAVAYLDALAAKIPMDNIVTSVVEGPAAQQIVEAVRTEGADLVVVASHGRGGLSEFDLGGTAQKVLSSADSSILLVRADAITDRPLRGTRYRRILAPVDCSLRGHWALQVAAAITRACGAELWAVHVIPIPEVTGGSEGDLEQHDLIERIAATNRERATTYLRNEVEPLASTDLKVVIRVLASGDTIAELATLVEKEQIDLSVICAHGASQRRRHPYGRTAWALLSYSGGPVLVLQDAPRRAPASSPPTVRRSQLRKLTVR